MTYKVGSEKGFHLDQHVRSLDSNYCDKESVKSATSLNMIYVPIKRARNVTMDHKPD